MEVPDLCPLAFCFLIHLIMSHPHFPPLIVWTGPLDSLGLGVSCLRTVLYMLSVIAHSKLRTHSIYLSPNTEKPNAFFTYITQVCALKCIVYMHTEGKE
jgi:hypothetical protein